jgi:hypothetical protein
MMTILLQISLLFLISSSANGFIISNRRLLVNRLTISAASSSPFEPPKTFIDCVKQAVSGTKAALNDGMKLIEVEFPPLPLEVLEDSSSSARDIGNYTLICKTYFSIL